MIKTTRWTSPCGCVVEYQWDSESDENTRVHTPSAIISVCNGHEPASDPVALYNQLVAESQQQQQAGG